MLRNIILAMCLFGILIFVHELGHFLMAKWIGVGVTEFSVGMGPRIAAVRWKKTIYTLKLLPLGGSVEIYEGEDRNIGKPFHDQPAFARALVIAGGALFNFLFAFCLAVIMTAGVGYDGTEIFSVEVESPAWEAGLRSGDRILSIGQQKVELYQEAAMYFMTKAPDSEQPLSLEYVRDSKLHQVTVRPQYSAETGGYQLGISYIPVQTKAGSVGDIGKYSIRKMKIIMETTFKSLEMLVRGEVKAGEAVAGPVKIVTLVGDAVGVTWEYGIAATLWAMSEFAILLSIGLGVVNLLPFPALDGGRLAFIAAEVILRKPLNQKFQDRVNQFGMICLMGIMAFVIVNDIVSLFAR